MACWTIEGIWDSRLNVTGTFPNRPNIPGMWKQKISKQRQTGNNAATEHRCESCMFVNGMGSMDVHLSANKCLWGMSPICKDMQRSCSNGLCRLQSTTLSSRWGITFWTEKKQCCKWTSSFCEWPWWTRIHHFGWSGHPEKERNERRKSYVGDSVKNETHMLHTDVTHELIAVIAA